MPLDAGVFLARHGDKLFKIRCGGGACGNGEVGIVRLVRELQSRAELRIQQADHADAVFKLGIFLIKVLIRQLAPGLDIHLIAAEEDARTVDAFITEALDKVDSLGSVLRRKRRERIELFAELREPDRDDGDAVHRGVHLLKILH